MDPSTTVRFSKDPAAACAADNVGVGVGYTIIHWQLPEVKPEVGWPGPSRGRGSGCSRACGPLSCTLSRLGGCGWRGTTLCDRVGCAGCVIPKVPLEVHYNAASIHDFVLRMEAPATISDFPLTLQGLTDLVEALEAPRALPEPWPQPPHCVSAAKFGESQAARGSHRATTASGIASGARQSAGRDASGSGSSVQQAHAVADHVKFLACFHWVKDDTRS